MSAEDVPIKVIAVDLERLPEEIPASRADGGRYAGLWLLVRRGGVPLRLLRLRFAGPAITAAEIERELEGLEPANATRARGPLPTPPPRISVVVCSLFSREDELRETLASIAALDYPDFEVLLVDNRRQDGAEPDWLGLTDGVRVLRERQPGLSAARNRGLAEASGSLIAFTDDDVVVDAGWLDSFARRFAAHPDEICVTGLVLPAGLETVAQAAFDDYYGGFGPQSLQAGSRQLARLPRHGLLSRATVLETDDAGRTLSRFPLYRVGRFGVGANMAFRTAALREAGGFDTALSVGTPARGGEDIAMFARLAWRGERLGFEPAALVFHRHRADDRELRRQIEDYGVGIVATLLALIAEDPRHLGAMAATAPQAGFEIAAAFTRKLLRAGRTREPAAQPQSSSAQLARLELRGMARGPLAYLRSRRLSGRSSPEQRRRP